MTYFQLYATYNAHDDKLKLFGAGCLFSKQDCRILSQSGYRWNRFERCYTGLWYPEVEDLILKLCGKISRDAPVQEQNLNQKEITQRHLHIKALKTEMQLYLKKAQRYQEIISQLKQTDVFELIIYTTIFDDTMSEFTFTQRLQKYEHSISLLKAIRERIITPTQAKEIALQSYEKKVTLAKRWIVHIEQRIEYERTLLGDRAGKVIEDKWLTMQIGGRILIKEADRKGWHIITDLKRHNAKIISINIKDENLMENSHFANWKCSIDRVTDYQAP